MFALDCLELRNNANYEPILRELQDIYQFKEIPRFRTFEYSSIHKCTRFEKDYEKKDKKSKMFLELKKMYNNSINKLR